MALTIVENIPLISLAGNPMKIKIHTDNLFDSAVRRSLYTIILNIYDSDDDLIQALSLEPDNDGDAWFDLSDAFYDLKPTITYPLSESTPVVEDETAIKQFYFKLAEGYGIPYEEQNESVTSQNYYVIPGGLPNSYLKKLDKLDTNFYEQIYLINIWLTNQPDRKTVFNDQPEQLRFLHLSAVQQTALLIVERIDKYGVKTTVTLWTGSLDAYTIYCVNAIWSFIADADTIYCTLYMKVGSSKITNDAVFILDNAKPVNTRYVHFRNSLGAFDCMPLTGRMLTEIETKTTDFVSPEISKLYEALVPEQSRAEGIKFLKGTIGWKNDAEIDWAQELLLSEEKYIVIDDALESIVIGQDRRQLKSDDNSPRSLNIEAAIGSSDFFFSRLNVRVPYLKLMSGGYLRLMNGGKLKITILR